MFQAFFLHIEEKSSFFRHVPEKNQNAKKALASSAFFVCYV
jgi:hypothetical protein